MATCKVGHWQGKPDCAKPAEFLAEHDNQCPWNEGDDEMVFCGEHIDEMMAMWPAREDCTPAKVPLGEARC